MRRAAFVLGVLAGLAYLGCSRLLLRARVDDPLEACAVHGGCSLVGILGAPPGPPQRALNSSGQMLDCTGEAARWSASWVRRLGAPRRLLLGQWPVGLAGACWP